MLKGQLYFDPDDMIYQTHFPSCPVVPGSVIVQGFIKAIQASGSNPSRIQIKNFRFQTFVNPGTYAYHVEKKSKGYHCRLMFENTIMAKGIICCET